MSRNKRIEPPVAVPAEPVLPSVEVKRKTFFKYVVSLKLIDGQTFTHSGADYSTDSVWRDTHVIWDKFGRNRSERFARRMLAKYMRQIGYRTEDAVRYVGKLV